MYKIQVTQNEYSWIIDTAQTVEQAGLLVTHYLSTGHYEQVEVVCPPTSEGL